jgi:predicted alpha/beta-fold hydrolase
MLLITAGLKLYLAAHQHGAELRKHPDVQLDKAMQGGNIADFDNFITVPMWGYEVSSSIAQILVLISCALVHTLSISS